MSAPQVRVQPQEETPSMLYSMLPRAKRCKNEAEEEKLFPISIKEMEISLKSWWSVQATQRAGIADKTVLIRQQLLLDLFLY